MELNEPSGFVCCELRILVQDKHKFCQVHTSMSKPMFLFPSWCAEYSLEMSSLPFTPEFSASARGKASNASANFLMAYCSRPGQDCSKKWEQFCDSEI